MHLNVLKTYEKEIGLSEVPESLSVPATVALLLKGLTIYSGTEDAINWKLVCHFVQALSSFVAQTTGQMKKKEAVSNETICSLITCTNAAFREPIMKCLQGKLSEQQYIGVYAPLFVGIVGLAFESDDVWGSAECANLEAVLQSASSCPKILLPVLSVMKVPREPRPAPSLVYRIRVLAACAIAMHATKTPADDPASAEKDQQRRKDVLALIVAVLDRAETQEKGEFTAALSPLRKYPEIKQQLKLLHHLQIIRKYGGPQEESYPGRLLSVLYEDKQELSSVGASWEVLTASAQSITAHEELRTQAMEEVKSLLRAADPIEAAQMLDGLKNKPASRAKKDTTAAPSVDQPTLQAQINALHLWCALLQWASFPAPDGHTGHAQNASADPVPELLVSYQDAALKLLRSICAQVHSRAGDDAALRAELFIICGALAFTARPLYSSLFISGRQKEQAMIFKLISGLYTVHASVVPELLPLLCELRTLSNLTAAMSGASSKTDVESLTALWSAPAASTCHGAVDCFALVCLSLLSHEVGPTQQAMCAKYAIMNKTACSFPQSCQEFVLLAKAAYQACASQQRRGGAEAQVAQATLVWVCALCAKVLMLVYFDLHGALTWSGYASSSAHKCDSVQLSAECSFGVLEALLLRADLYDHWGNLDGALVYLREGTTTAQRLHSPGAVSIAALHSVRIYQRSASQKLHSLVDELLTSGKEQIYAATWQLGDTTSQSVRAAVATLDGLFTLRSEEDRTESCALPKVESVKYRYLFRYWDLSVADPPSEDQSSAGAIYHTFMPSSLRRQLQDALMQKNITNSLIALSGTSDASPQQPVSAQSLLKDTTASGAFDAIRDIRRRCALETVQSSNSACGCPAFLTFLSGASSCGVSTECIGDGSECSEVTEAESEESPKTPSPHSLTTFAGAAACIQKALLGCNSSTALIQDKLTQLLKHCDTLSSGAAGSALCFLTIDQYSKHLLVGRLDQSGVPLVAALPMQDRLTQLLARWDELQERNQAMLRAGLDVEQVTKLSEEQKRSWWSARQKYDTDIEATMSDMQDLLGPWRVLLSTKPCRCVVTADQVQEALFGAVKSKAVSKGVAAELSSIARWLQLIGSNYTPSAPQLPSAAPSSRIMSLMRAEAEEAVRAVLRQLSPFKTRTDAELQRETEAVVALLEKSCSMESTTIITTSSGIQIAEDCPPSVEELSSLKVTELRALLKDAGLDPVGKKQDLVSRLLEHQGRSGSGSGSGSPACASSGTTPAVASQAGTGHLVLVLDEQLQRLPLECMPALRAASCSRVPSFAVLLRLISLSETTTAPSDVDELAEKLDSAKLTETKKSTTKKTTGKAKSAAKSASHSSPEDKENASNQGGSSSWRGVSVEKGWYALDIEGNLPATRSTLQPFLSAYSDKWDWTGVVAAVPPEDTTRKLHESSELFIFCGHGAGERMHDTFRVRKFRSCPASLLWGCSSGRLKARGVHDALGTALYYLMAGAPFLVANLWDVTDKDIDKLCMAHMERIFAPVSESASCSADSAGGNGQAAVALAQCRDVCRMPYAVGAAPVVYGIPALLCAAGKC